MWAKEIMGFELYYLVGAFVIYSMLGWLVESIYMSFCNKKITNRGFAKGPFCPIYGFGAVLGYLILSPLRDNVVQLYLAGAFLATAFEYLVGIAMIHFLGELWWDYNKKPFNYKGIICLESTRAWGFYAVGIVCFLHLRVCWLLDKVDRLAAIRGINLVLTIAAIDYIIQLTKVLHIDMQAKKDKLIEKYQSFKARWY